MRPITQLTERGGDVALGAESDARGARVRRIVGTTLGLSVSGGIAGAAVGAAFLGILDLAVDGLGGFPYIRGVYGVALSLGAIVGGVWLPILTWAMLRHVSFWRVFTAAAAGTLIGGMVGAMLSHLHPLPTMLSAVGGFVAGLGWLRWKSLRR
jgi:hypothetical protein